MKDISLHIMDIVQNSVNAGATQITISVSENANGMMVISVKDNGCGMDKDTIEKVTNPFFTTGNKPTGLGIPLFEQSTRQSGGSLNIDSEKGKGTIVTACFQKNHIDMPPLGDIGSKH
ncbi:MAG: HAMP domain-containing histidine kinase [Bacteroidales bacterium]|nr:HAMP domain-containing histidine kinase [Bacteroidales bacterium]